MLQCLLTLWMVLLSWLELLLLVRELLPLLLEELEEMDVDDEEEEVVVVVLRWTCWRAFCLRWRRETFPCWRLKRKASQRSGVYPWESQQSKTSKVWRHMVWEERVVVQRGLGSDREELS